MIRVLQDNSKKMITPCGHCNSLLEYGVIDMLEDQDCFYNYIICPVCGHQIIIAGEVPEQ